MFTTLLISEKQISTDLGKNFVHRPQILGLYLELTICPFSNFFLPFSNILQKLTSTSETPTTLHLHF